MKHIKKFAALSLLIAGGLLSCSSSDSRPPMLDDVWPDQKPFPRRPPIVDASYHEDATFPKPVDSGIDSGLDALVPEDNGILYHGGPIMVGPVNVYYIWYGDWSKNQAAKPILVDLARNIGKSTYYKINTDYYSVGANQSVMSIKANLFNSLHHLGVKGGHSNYDQNEMSKKAPINFSGERTYVSDIVNYVGSYDDNYSLGKFITQDDVFNIVKSTIDNGVFPNDYNGLYFVLTSADVIQSYSGYNFCKAFCGWHGYNPVNSVNIKYSFVGDPAQCPASCGSFNIDSASYSGSDYLTPNNNFTGDSMASILVHELEEMTSDPELNAWFDQYGLENADKCAWTFGNTYTTSNGAIANVKINNKDYLIQQNWVNANGGFCALQK